MFPGLVWAHTPVKLFYIAFGVFLIPAVIGILIVGKGKRKRWSII
jgi:hypothetical protein